MFLCIVAFCMGRTDDSASCLQYGQLIGVTSQLIASMSQTEGCIDIFPGMVTCQFLLSLSQLMPRQDRALHPDKSNLTAVF